MLTVDTHGTVRLDSTDACDDRETWDAADVTATRTEGTVAVVTPVFPLSKEYVNGSVEVVVLETLLGVVRREAAATAVIVLVAHEADAEEVLVLAEALGILMMRGPSRDVERGMEELVGTACRMMIGLPRKADKTGMGWVRFTCVRLALPAGTVDTYTRAELFA